ncbi:Interferon-inducible GTPase 5 [Channa argus]|uniref:Interferon-inducible GTPase 5 n=1 Tax=Channa argus TaxID=215402 RepID=A0A6G1Q7B7_CHAAH|nr:Interferon-inducible GTPase 5 [Channa argus]
MDITFDCESLKQEVKKALEKNDQGGAVAMIQKYLDKVNNTPQNIAITGETGSGKSTFVNAFRGISNNDNGSAPTGCVETTLEATPYHHPNYPNVILWDLPGIGSTNFPADKYLQSAGFKDFDFFIIISDTRFRENDVMLALEIQKLGKKFYFVCSKIDNDLQAEERSQSEFSAENTLARIRQNCVRSLEQQRIESPQVFVLSSFELQKHDFPLLHKTLERELPEHKRYALLMAMPSINREIIKKKKEAFQAQIKYYATLSAAVAGVPLPGLSFAVDIGLLVTVVTQYVVGFGLDIPSLQRLANSTGVSFKDLIAVKKSPLAATAVTAGLMLSLLGQCVGITAMVVAQEWCRWIPILRILLARKCCFITTCRGLTYFLDMLADDAHRVFKQALCLNTSV